MVLNRHQLIAILTKAGAGHEFPPFSLHLFDTLPSTNQTLWQLIAQGAEPGTVVIAGQQTAGRGQWGHKWSSPPGGLYLSLAIAPQLSATQSYQLTLCSAWGIATALRDCGIPVQLKWPNDLILGDRKLGGILTETKVFQGRIAQAVVGVGINWANPVPETGIALQSFLVEQPGTIITSLEILTAVTLQGLVSGLQHCSPTGIDTWLPSYHQLLTNMSQIVSINGCTGTIIGITPTGELRVRLHPKPSGDFLPKAEGKRQKTEGFRLETDDDLLATNVDSLDPKEICLQPGSISLGYF